MTTSTSITPKRAADELRASKLLGLMIENPTRTQKELCQLLGIRSRNTLTSIIRSDTFQNQAGELLEGLTAQLAVQLADGVPDVLAYQLNVGAGKIGEQVRDHVGAGRVIREFLTLLMEYGAVKTPSGSSQLAFSTNNYFNVVSEDDDSIIEGQIEIDEGEVHNRFNMTE